MENTLRQLERIKYGMELCEPCPDCGCKKGEYHQDSCDQEVCPHCLTQFISCECEGEFTTDNEGCEYFAKTKGVKGGQKVS